jgi:hypothetical protein
MTALRHGSRNAGWHASTRGRAGRAAPARKGPRPRRARAQPRRCSGRGQQASPATCGRLWPATTRAALASLATRAPSDATRPRARTPAQRRGHGRPWGEPPTGAAPVPTGADATGCRRALPASALAPARVTAAMRALLGLLARARALLVSRWKNVGRDKTS